MADMKLGSKWIENIRNPKPHEIDLDHMRLRLETDRRFSGNPAAYTIAEHLDLVARLAEKAGESADVFEWALHHDCHEYATGDIPTPIKRALGTQICVIERAFDAAICGALLIKEPSEATRKRVKIYDRQAASIEWYFKMGESEHHDFPKINPEIVPKGWI